MDRTAPHSASEPFAALFAAQFDPAVRVDTATGRFIDANPAAEALLGYSAAELSGMSPADIHPHELGRLDAFIDAVNRAGSWTAEDLSCRLRDGTLFPAVVRAVRLPGEGRGQLLIVIRDRREHELAALGGTVRQLAHDLKNTLTTAQLMCDRLAAHGEERVRLSAENMTRALERAVQLCRQTADAGRGAEPAPERERFLLTDVLEEIAATAVLPGDDGTALADLSEAPVTLDADYDQVYRILLNLVRNAFDAGARRVTVCGRQSDGAAVIEVGDDGPGLPEGVRARLGAEHGPGRGAGTGLGLAIAAGLCHNHGGTLEPVETGPGGTVLRVRLPFDDPV